MPDYPLTIWTVRSQLENRYTAMHHCPRCHDHLGPVDLRALVMRGYGEKALRELGLKSPCCDVPVGFVMHPPTGEGGPVNPLGRQ